MSTHARGGPLRSILGSVANEAVRRSHRPVLLVRRVPHGHEVEAAQNAEPARVAGSEAWPVANASASIDASGYELLPDAFTEPEAGLPPHRQVDA